MRRVVLSLKKKIWLSFRNRLIAMLVLIFSLSLLSCYISVGIIYVRDARLDWISTQSEQMNLFNAFFEQYISKLEENSLNIRWDDPCMILLDKEELNSEEKAVIKNFLRTNLNDNEDSVEITLFLVNSDMKFDIKLKGNPGYQWFYGMDVSLNDWYRELTKENSWWTVGPVYETKGEKYFNFHRAIIKEAPNRIVATISYKVSYKRIESLIEEQNGTMLIFDKMGRLFWGGDDKLQKESRTILENVEKDVGSFSFCVGQERFWAVYDRSEEWVYTLLVPESEFVAKLSGILPLIILAGVLLWMVFVLTVLACTNTFTRPLKEFTEQIASYDTECREPIEINTNYMEFTRLADKFNLLIFRAETLHRERLKSEVAVRDIQLKMLNSQIDSHFLYNTLQTISTKALMSGSDEVHSMVNALAKNFRYAIRGGDEVSLLDEVNFCKSYIYLQKQRFGETLDVSFSVDAAVKSCVVPKFLLQVPLENAIIHGMKRKHNILSVEVVACVSEEHLFLTVTDNGVGITPARLLEVNRQIKGEQENAQECIGLANLKTRLCYLYGEQAGICLESEKDETCTKIIIPFERRRGFETDDC